MEFLRKGILTKRQTINGQGQELVTTELNPAHPLVQESLPGYQTAVFAALPIEDEYADSDEDEEPAAEDDDYDLEADSVVYDDDEDELEEEDNRGNLLAPGEARDHAAEAL